MSLLCVLVGWKGSGDHFNGKVSVALWFCSVFRPCAQKEQSLAVCVFSVLDQETLVPCCWQSCSLAPCSLPRLDPFLVTCTREMLLLDLPSWGRKGVRLQQLPSPGGMCVEALSAAGSWM